MVNILQKTFRHPLSDLVLISIRDVTVSPPLLCVLFQTVFSLVYLLGATTAISFWGTFIIHVLFEDVYLM